MRSVPARPALVVDHDGGALLAAALAAELRLQRGDRQVASARDEMARIQPMGMPAPLAEHPQKPTRLQGVT